jgi:hypothetical protein
VTINTPEEPNSTYSITINFTEDGDKYPHFDDLNLEGNSLKYTLHIHQIIDGEAIDLTKVIRIAILDSAKDFDLHLN